MIFRIVELFQHLRQDAYSLKYSSFWIVGIIITGYPLSTKTDSQMNPIRNSSGLIILFFVMLVSFTGCKSKKKAMEAAAEKARIEREAVAKKQQQEEEDRRKAQEAEEGARQKAAAAEDDARRAAEAKA